MNRDEVLERIQPIMNTQVRTIEANPQTRIRVTPEMVILQPGNRQHQLQVTKEGVKSLAKYIGMPPVMVSKLSRDTFGIVATELLCRAERFSVMTNDGEVTGVGKPTELHGVNPTRALVAIEKGIRGIEYHRVMILENSVVSLELIGEKREPVVKGDLIRAGAQVTFSPIGTVLPQVQSYALRLACTNGQTSNMVLREFTYGGDDDGDDGDIWQWFKSSARDAYNSLHGIVERYKQMIDEEISPEDRAMVLEAMLRGAKLKGREATAVRALAIENPPATSYDMMNLITNASSHVLEDPDSIRRVQQASASYTHSDTHARVCPVCHTRRG